MRRDAYLSYFFLFALCVAAAGLPWSVYLLSNSVILLSLLLLVEYKPEENQIGWNSKWRSHLDGVLHQPLLVSMIALFFAGLLSGFWTENMKYFVWYNQMQLPFLLLPLVFYRYGSLTQIQWTIALQCFLLSCLLTSLWVGSDYLKHFEQYQLNLLKGTPFVIHISHIRFSMIIGLAAILCFHCSGVFSSSEKKSKFRWPYISLFLFFFGFNHVLSTKTGLFGMYLGLGLYLLVYFAKKRMYVPIVISTLTLVSILLLSIYFVPGLKNKLSYTLWQIGEIGRGKWLYYSDIERWVSWKMGFEMIRHEPLMGTGIGDLYRETENVYQECLNTSVYKLPHNQFIFQWAFMGLPGLLSLLSVIYHSLLQKKWILNPLVLAIQSILVSSFLVEYTLGTQTGCSLYVFFTLICWVWMKNND